MSIASSQERMHKYAISVQQYCKLIMSESSDSWGQNQINPSHSFEYMNPKKIMQIVNLLKHESISVKAKFGFSCESDLNRFYNLKAGEEEDYFEAPVKQTDLSRINQIKKIQNATSNKSLTKGFSVQMGSIFKSQIFMKVFKADLDKLEKSEKVVIYPLQKRIFIKSEHKVGQQSIIYSELTDMIKKLQTQVFYRDKELVELVRNSKVYVENLQKKGVFVSPFRLANMNIAFYSTAPGCSPGKIRQIIDESRLFKPKIISLASESFNYTQNVLVFDLLQKGLKQTIEKINQIYEAGLEINKVNSCFILHLRHDVFSEEPLTELKESIKDFFSFSFKVPSPRGFLNFIKKNKHKYSFIQAKSYRQVVYCCIDRKKLHKKELLFEVLFPFLNNIREKSNLFLYLKSNCVFSPQKSTIQNIKLLAEKNELDIQEEDSQNKDRNYKLVLRPALLEANKEVEMFNLSKFFIELLITDPQESIFTTNQLNEMINNYHIANPNTYESGRQGNRNSKEEPIQKSKQKVLKVYKQKQPSSTTAEKDDKESTQKIQRPKESQVQGSEKKIKKFVEKEEKQDNRQQSQQFTLVNSVIIPKSPQKTVSKQNGSKKEEKKEQRNQRILDKLESQSCQEKPKQQKQEIKEQNVEQKKETKQQCGPFLIDFAYIEPENIGDSKSFMKGDRDRKVEEAVRNKFQIQTKAYKLKINHNLFKVKERQDKIDKTKLFLTHQILNETTQKPVIKTKMSKFKEMQDEKKSYLISKTDDDLIWVPTHLIIRYI